MSKYFIQVESHGITVAKYIKHEIQGCSECIFALEDDLMFTRTKPPRDYIDI